MSLWRRRPARSAPGWLGSSAPWMSVAATGYADVDASKLDTSLQSVAVATAVDLIASLASELPVDVYRGTGQDRTQLPMPSWLEDPGGDGHGREDWSYRVVTSWLLRGNLYGEELDRAPAGYLRQVEVFHPDCVSGWLEDGEPVWYVGGRRVERRFLHRRAYPMPGQIQGRSPIAYHASTIGVSLAATAFGQQWFRDGAHPTGILRNTEVPLDPEKAKTAKDRFMAALRGTREPVVFGKGWEFDKIQVAPEESQFLETMGYSEAQCARIFGPGIAEVCGYAVKGSSLTYANIADRDLHLLKYALNKWFRRLERLLSQFLPKPQYVVLNRDALLETTTMQRYLAHASALGNQPWKTANEVREKENLPPVAGGDKLGAAAPAAPAPPGQDPPAPGDDEEEDEDQ